MRIYHAHMVATPKASRKTATNVTLNAELVRQAKALGLNLSELCERALVAALRERERAAWLAENEAAIDDYAEWVDKHGLFSDDWRRF